MLRSAIEATGEAVGRHLDFLLCRSGVLRQKCMISLFRWVAFRVPVVLSSIFLVCLFQVPVGGGCAVVSLWVASGM